MPTLLGTFGFFFLHNS